MERKSDTEEVLVDKWHMRIRIVALYGWTVLCLLLLLVGKLSINF